MEKILKDAVSRFSGITPWDILDIVLLSCLFFSVYRFTRRRRAFTTLIGIGAFIAVRFALKASGLTASFVVLDYFYKVGAILPVVIFQADIRSFLEKIGAFFLSFKSNAVKLFRPKSESAEVEAISKAVVRMSSSHTGALIVLQKNTAFDEISGKGVLIDSVISSELICNIFFSPAPLHDGAIIIQGKRIRSAACMLPNNDTSIGHSYGSRHRAAVGMSRTSDALVIVVSEEDGKVSYAIGGDLKRDASAEKIRELLDDYYGVKRPKVKDKQKTSKKNSK